MPKKDGEQLILKSFRLPKEQLDFIDDLTKIKVMGTDRSSVLRYLIGKAIDGLMTNDFVRRYAETRDFLKKLP